MLHVATDSSNVFTTLTFYVDITLYFQSIASAMRMLQPPIEVTCKENQTKVDVMAQPFLVVFFKQ